MPQAYSRTKQLIIQNGFANSNTWHVGPSHEGEARWETSSPGHYSGNLVTFAKWALASSIAPQLPGLAYHCLGASCSKLN